MTMMTMTMTMTMTKKTSTPAKEDRASTGATGATPARRGHVSLTRRTRDRLHAFAKAHRRSMASVVEEVFGKLLEKIEAEERASN